MLVFRNYMKKSTLSEADKYFLAKNKSRAARAEFWSSAKVNAGISLGVIVVIGLVGLLVLSVMGGAQYFIEEPKLKERITLLEERVALHEGDLMNHKQVIEGLRGRGERQAIIPAERLSDGNYTMTLFNGVWCATTNQF